MMIRYASATLISAVLFTSFWFAGCTGIPLPGDQESESSEFLGIDMSGFSETNPIPVQHDATADGSSDVTFPEDVLATAPDEVIMLVSKDDIEVVVDEAETGDGASDVVSPAGIPVERHASVTFRLAPAGADACASNIQIGPVGVTVVGQEVFVSNSPLPLTAAARQVVRSGRFEMCAQTLADFDGLLYIKKLSLEFGRLKPGEDPVELCHIPPGNPDNRHTITVGASAVDTHLGHSDYLGPCRDVVEDLDLTAMCSTDPDTQRRWRVHNPNTFTVDVTWEVYETDQSGTQSAVAGDTFFFSETEPDANTTIIKWIDAVGDEQSYTAASTDAVCPLDADEDGVTDDADSCADTPAGETPDSNGCSCSQRDADEDGVHDCDDVCPDTAAGVPVDDTGCAEEALDDDDDGVDNDADDCPNTPAAEQADASGCSCSQRDGDADGVSDCEDACPDTPLGDDVDTDGCTTDLSDADGDGVTDDTDLCLNTPEGEAVDADGCGCSQLDEDADGVVNCDDLCPGTTAGSTVDVNGCPHTSVDAGDDVTLDEVECVTLQGSATGGTPPYTYSWSAPGWDGSFEQSPVVVPSVTTVYTLTVTDWSSPPEVMTDSVTVTINTRDDLQYTIVDLGSLSNNTSYPSALNNLGQVVGYYYTDSWDKHAFFYADGVMSDLGTLGGSESYARDINDAGQVVGQAYDADGNLRAFLWDATNGMRDLGTLGGSTAVAYGINGAGDVVGQAATGSATHAFLHQAGTMTDLGTTEYFQSGAFDINDAGQIVGTFLEWGSDQQAFLYDSGTVTSLGSPLLTGSRAQAINSDGVVIGYSWGLGENRSFLYACDTVIDLGALTEFPRVYAWDINDSGQIVGYGSSSDGTLSHAVIYTGGELHDLTELLVPGHEWEHLTVAFAINNAGQIAGYGRIGGQYRAYLMTPLP